MMTVPDDNNISSPSLVELALHVRSHFRSNQNSGHRLNKVIVKADEVARIYHSNREHISASELDVLYEVLREFGIVIAHIPADFHIHVANVIKCLELKNETVTRSHVAGLIFSRMF